MQSVRYKNPAHLLEALPVPLHQIGRSLYRRTDFRIQSSAQSRGVWRRVYTTKVGNGERKVSHTVCTMCVCECERECVCVSVSECMCE